MTPNRTTIATPGNHLAATGLLLALTLALGACGDRGAGAPGAAETGKVNASATATQGSAAKDSATSAVAAPAVTTSDPMVIAVDAELGKRLKTGTVTTGKVADTIRIAGRLEANQYRSSRIGAPITGRLTQVEAQIGQVVRQGQVLAELNSPELAQAQLNFLRAHSQQQLLTRAVERAQLLLDADVIGSAELLRRQSEATVAAAEKRAASDQLRALGLSAERVRRLEETGQIQQTASITATLGGTIIDRKVAQGQVVNPADVLFIISDLTSLWAAAEVPEQDAQFVKLGQRVQIEVPALDNERFAGKVAFVADVVNPETRTVRVGVDLENKALRFKPSMLITMLVEGRVAERQVVPASAIVRENNADYLFVQVRPGLYRMTPVEVGPERDGLRSLTKPLRESAQVVLDGAFHLNNVRAQRALDGK
jgi:cobalt-zinc-cadmium efflux system membrane fusion protein